MTGQRPAARRRRRRAGHSRCSGPLRAAGGFRRGDVLERPRGDRPDADAAGGSRDGRSPDAGRRRARRAAGDSRDGSALPDGADDRLRVGRQRGRGDQARRDGLPEQAARLRAARAAADQRARRDRSPPQRAVDGRRPRAAARVRRDDRARSGDAGPVRHDPPARAARPHRPDHRRDRDRQGARGPRAAPRRARGASAGS